MPASMKMYISNGNQNRLQMEMLNKLKTVSVPVPTQKSPLNGSMISRISSARSGCGSCGK